MEKAIKIKVLNHEEEVALNMVDVYKDRLNSRLADENHCDKSHDSNYKECNTNEEDNEMNSRASRNSRVANESETSEDSDYKECNSNEQYSESEKKRSNYSRPRKENESETNEDNSYKDSDSLEHDNELDSNDFESSDDETKTGQLLSEIKILFDSKEQDHPNKKHEIKSKLLAICSRIPVNVSQLTTSFDNSESPNSDNLETGAYQLLLDIGNQGDDDENPTTEPDIQGKHMNSDNNLLSSKHADEDQKTEPKFLTLETNPENNDQLSIHSNDEKKPATENLALNINSEVADQTSTQMTTTKKWKQNYKS